MSRCALMLSGCTAWMASEAKWYDDSLDEYLGQDNAKRNLGKAVHQAIDDVISGKVNSAETWEQKNLVNHALEYLQKVLSARCKVIQSEVPVGINWQTGEAEIFPKSYIAKIANHEANKERPDWQFGIADLYCQLKDGSILIGDWKTGSPGGAKEQLLSLACAFRNALPGPKKQVSIVCLELTEDKIIPNEEPITKQELHDHQKAMAAATASAGPYVPGIHCTQLYCPHLAFCPSVTGILEDSAVASQGLLPAEALIKKYPMTDKPTSNEHAGAVMAKVSACQRQSKYYTAAMKKYIAEGGKVTLGAYEWKERGRQGFRWGKK
jgi:hypothetical protein